MNAAYRDLILARTEAAIAAANEVGSVKHRGLKGQLREIVVRDLFRPLFPADIGTGTGEIISSDDRHSGEQDIVIFDKRIVPPVLFERSIGLFPIESVLFAIEVKSRLTSSGLRQAHESAVELRSFTYLPGSYDGADQPQSMTLNQMGSALLAFDTDLSVRGKTEIERYDELHASEDPPLKIICVIDRGCWIWRNEGWFTWDPPYKHGEMLLFLSVIMNTYRQTAASRREPRMGMYILD